jgi:aspartyl-tRNA(Asn)/glutamyl-tRNA(Gln) amidotransferase subunit C
MSLTQEEVDKIAELAKLELNESERTAFRDQLSSILAYVGKLAEVDVEDVEPMSHIVPVNNVMRADSPEPCESAVRAGVIESFPESEGGLLKVKAVFE